MTKNPTWLAQDLEHQSGPEEEIIENKQEQDRFYVVVANISNFRFALKSLFISIFILSATPSDCYVPTSGPLLWMSDSSFPQSCI